MIVVDTNVVSEMMRPSPSNLVYNWMARQVRSNLFLSAITEAELRYGVELLPDGRRKDRLQGLTEAMLRVDFAGRILPFDSAAAQAYAVIATARRLAGTPVKYADCQIAATARSRGWSVATRNVRDFEGCGVDVINPWSDV